MTENKRFTIDVEETTQENALFENDKFVCFEDDTDEYLKKINEISDENEQLKHDVTVLIQANQDYRKENEQLKQLVNIADDLIDKLGSETMQNEWIKNF